MAYLDNNGLLYFWQQLKTLLAGKQAKITASGILKGDGSGGVTAATSGTDYQAPLPSQSGNNGKYLKTNGSAISWETVDALPSQTGKTGKYLKTDGTDASWEDLPGGVSPYSSNPEMDGTASSGSSDAYARGDHVHPSDTSRQAKITASGILKGDGAGGVTAATAGTDYIADVSGKLDKSGGTMTGDLTLSGAPSANLHAATKKYVDDSIATSATGTSRPQGEVNAQSTIENSSYKNGWYWVVGTAGTYVGQTCEVGDVIYASADKGASYSASDFFVVQANLNIVAITNAEIDAILAQ